MSNLEKGLALAALLFCVLLGFLCGCTTRPSISRDQFEAGSIFNPKLCDAWGQGGGYSNITLLDMFAVSLASTYRIGNEDLYPRAEAILRARKEYLRRKDAEDR